jgi:hypothetical protein
MPGQDSKKDSKKDWKKIADGLNSGIPDAQLEAISQTLDALDKTFHPLTLTLLPEDDIATPFTPEIAGSK